MNAEDIAKVFNADIENWYEGQRNDEIVNRNVMSVGLIMCEHMSDHFPLHEDKWFTGSQVRLLGRIRINRILASHGEDRPFASEAGRTSRGSQDLARSFQAVVNGSSVADEFGNLNEDDKLSVIHLLQARMVERIRIDFFDRQRLPLEIDFSKQTRFMIDELLAAAKSQSGNTVGAVAQHLVGAILAIRHEELEIENQSYTTADLPTSRQGDFMLHDTAIHVTTAPKQDLLEKCKSNLEQGYRSLILTLEDKVEAARGLADIISIRDRIAIRSIEEFVASNVDDIARYSEPATRKALGLVFKTYNRRVEAVEADLSLMVEIPGNLVQD